MVKFGYLNGKCLADILVVAADADGVVVVGVDAVGAAVFAVRRTAAGPEHLALKCTWNEKISTNLLRVFRRFSP